MPAISFGLRLWAAVIVAQLVAYWLQLDDPFWAGISAAIVSQPRLGASMRRGRFRAIGTVVGGVSVVALTAAFPQNTAWLLLSLALFAAACGYFATILPNFAGYAAALAGFTAALVFSNVMDDPAKVFDVAVTRVLETCIGVFSAQLVHVLTDFGGAPVRLASAFADIGKGIADGIKQVLDAEPAKLVELRAVRRALIRRVTALPALIDEAIGEPTHLRSRPRGLQVVVEALFSALSAWRALGTHLYLAGTEQGRAASVALRPAMAKIAQANWLTEPLAVRGMCETEAERLLHTPAPDLSTRLVLEHAAQALRSLGQVANGLVLVTNPGRERRVRARFTLHVPDVLPGLLNALRTFLAMTAVGLFWIATGWPEGTLMVVFTVVGVTLFAPRADAAYTIATDFAMGGTLGCILATVFALTILPSAPENFVFVALALALVLVPFGAMSAGPWRPALSLGVVVGFVALLSLQNGPTFNGGRLLNVGLAILLGSYTAAISFRVLPPLAPATRTHRLLALTLRDLRRLAVGRRRFTRGAWIGLISQRLAVIPAGSTLEDEALLLAGLSVGEETIALLEARAHLATPENLDRALRSLAKADVQAAHAGFSHFCSSPGEAPANPQAAREACVRATVIAEALERHPDFFGSKA